MRHDHGAARRRNLLPLLLLAGAAAVLIPSEGVGADDKTPGKYHENKLVGFRFRPLNDWAAVPPGTDPNDPKVGGFYSDAAKYDRNIKPDCSVYAFKLEREATATEDAQPLGGGDGKDPPEPPKGPSEADLREEMMSQFRMKSTRQVLDQTRDRAYEIAEQVYSRWDEKKQKKAKNLLTKKEPVVKEVKTKDDLITFIDGDYVVPLTNGEILVGKIVAAFIRNDEYEVGVIYEIPESEWKKYGPGVLASLKSIEFLDGSAVAEARQDLADALSGAKTDDERWLETIKRKVVAGWAYLQTKNYLLIYDKTVKPDRVKLMAVQIEAIRKDVYEELFPSDRPVTAVSVVRVCKDKGQYMQYGGSGSSAGYWSPSEQELVFYEDGTKDAFRVLYHEAFHQYIFYSVGSVSPHSWFNEGHGDYFSGHNISPSGKFIPKPFSWRQSIIKGAMGSKTYVPLKIFVKYSQAEYYVPAQAGQNYAQGWSMIWFLRRTRNPAWQGILERYFAALKSGVTKWVDEQIAARKADGSYTEGWKPPFTPDEVEENARTQALEAAFGSFDDKTWDRFEKEWKDFKY